MSEQAQAQSERNRRKIRRGVVSSNKMEKTITVRIDRKVQHPIYGKTVGTSRKLMAHDDLGCDIGDTVEIMETRPLSKNKRWRVVRIIEKVK